MGGPMSYSRMVGRNDLNGVGYDHTTTGSVSQQEGLVGQVKSMIRGDMRRLEQDERDPVRLQQYADAAGITVEQVKKVLDVFFEGTDGYPGH